MPELESESKFQAIILYKSMPHVLSVVQPSMIYYSIATITKMNLDGTMNIVSLALSCLIIVSTITITITLFFKKENKFLNTIFKRSMTELYKDSGKAGRFIALTIAHDIVLSSLVSLLTGSKTGQGLVFLVIEITYFVLMILVVSPFAKNSLKVFWIVHQTLTLIQSSFTVLSSMVGEQPQITLEMVFFGLSLSQMLASVILTLYLFFRKKKNGGVVRPAKPENVKNKEVKKRSINRSNMKRLSKIGTKLRSKMGGNASSIGKKHEPARKKDIYDDLGDCMDVKISLAKNRESGGGRRRPPSNFNFDW